jgi:hypothetical protein
MTIGLPRRDTYVAHGYTLADIYNLAVHAVRTDHWRADLEFPERVAAAWSAIATALCSSDTAPHRNELAHVGREASADVIDQNMRHRGIDKRAATFGESRVNFERFWTRLPGAPLEERVVDGVSLQQIWPLLKPTYQDALMALATYEDYAEAAKVMGLRYGAFCRRVRLGRLEFLRLWHEGEKPSAVWGRDKRQGRDNTGRTAVRVLARRSRLGGVA